MNGNQLKNALNNGSLFVTDMSEYSHHNTFTHIHSVSATSFDSVQLLTNTRTQSLKANMIPRIGTNTPMRLMLCFD